MSVPLLIKRGYVSSIWRDIVIVGSSGFVAAVIRLGLDFRRELEVQSFVM